jgi:hypothetical protein
MNPAGPKHVIDMSLLGNVITLRNESLACGDRRLVVRHVPDGCNAADRSRRAPCREVLLVGEAGVPKVHMHVHNSWQDEMISAINDFVGWKVAVIVSDCRNHAIAYPDGSRKDAVGQDEVSAPHDGVESPGHALLPITHVPRTGVHRPPP